MNLNPISVRNPKLCPIDPESKKRFGCFVTFRRNDFYISDELWIRMEYPEYVRFAIDESNTIIGICKTDAEDPFGIAIKMQENGGVKGTGHRNVLDKIVQALPYIIDLDNENFTFYRGFKADEYVCFETKSSVKKPIKRRKK